MRKPDLVIGAPQDPQTLRWVLFNWRGWQLCLHKWLRSDEVRAPHDHKSSNLSIILSPQGYVEHISDIEEIGDALAYEIVPRKPVHRWPFIPYFRDATTPHRIELYESYNMEDSRKWTRPVWSLWFRFPQWRRWGFWCQHKGWVDADDFLSAKDYYGIGTSEVGRGCE